MNVKEWGDTQTELADVEYELERGYISTDVIEEVLGGETVSEYKKLAEDEKKLRDEYTELGKKTDATLAERDRYSELKKEIAGLKGTDGIKKRLSDEVSELAKGTRLETSYAERDKRRRAFTADLSQYDEALRPTIERAQASGILNDTRRTHDFVELVAKIGSETGISFDFTNNAKLKESGLLIEGKTVNGYVTADGVTLNINSAKALGSVVGHEITHILEGTEHYEALRSFLFEHAGTKGEYESRRDALVKLYEGIEGTDIDAELTAELVGDYIFTDEAFVRQLSVEHRNVFRRIYDEIKHLCKLATAGSKQARQLEKAKRMFEKVYREGKGAPQKSPADGEAKARYSLEGYTEDGKGMYKSNFPKGTPKRAKSERILSYIQNVWSRKPIKLNITDPSGNIIRSIDAKFDPTYDASGNELSDATKLMGGNRHGTAAEQRVTLDLADDYYQIASDAIYNYSKAETGKNIPTHDGVKEWHYFVNDIYFAEYDSDDYVPYRVTINVKETSDGNFVYSFSAEKNNETNTPRTLHAAVKGAESSPNVPLATNSIPETAPDVNTKNNNRGKLLKDITKIRDITDSTDGQAYLKTAISADNTSNSSISQNSKNASAKFSLSSGGGNGYDGYSMSNNARAAYEGGEKPISKWTKEEILNAVGEIDTNIADKLNGVNLSTLKSRLLTKSSWHHTSEYYNKTDFYAVDEDLVKNLTDKDIAEMKAQKKAQKSEETSSNKYRGDIAYLEWDGTRKHPKAKDVELKDVNIEEKGSFYVVTDDDGNVLVKKKIGSNGTRVTSYTEVERRKQAELEKAKRIEEYSSPEALKYYNELRKSGYERSGSGSMYAKGRKPTPYDYYDLSEFFEKGEKRLSQNQQGGFDLEIWDGEKWIKEDIRYSISPENAYPTDGRHGGWRVTGEDIALAPERGNTGSRFEEVTASRAQTPGEMLDEIIDDIENGRIKAEDIKPELDELSKAAGTDAGELYAPTAEEVRAYDIEAAERRSRELGAAALKAYDAGDLEEWGRLFDERGALDDEIERMKRKSETAKEGLYAPTKWELQKPVQLDSNSALYQEIRESGKSPSTVIRDFIVSHFYGKPIKLSDGRTAIVDKNDAKELSKRAGKIKAAEVEKLQEIIDNALLYKSDVAADHNKFKSFSYYRTPVEIDGKKYDILLNVGLGKNDSREHLYAITDFNKKRDIAGTKSLASSEDNLLKSDDSDSSIPENGAFVKRNTAEGWQEVAATEGEHDSAADNREESATEEVKSAKILTEEPKHLKKRSGAWGMLKNLMFDKGMIFETMSLRSGNRELQAKWNSTRYAEGRAQSLMERGNQKTKSLKSIRDTVEKSGKKADFYSYMYHLLNVDRMSLSEKYGRSNQSVFNDETTAQMSQAIAGELARKNSEFKAWAQDVYNYMGVLREMLVEGGIISQKTADLWAKRYPHYIPIRRAEYINDFSFLKDSKSLKVASPVKKATGGNSDIAPLFESMGQRTVQTFKAVSKNKFGLELMRMLNSEVDNSEVDINEVIEKVDSNDELVEKGKSGKNPTFTVFEDGKKVKFEITEEMYDALKPTSKALSYRSKPIRVINSIYRGFLTEYNPIFMVTNPIKDAQDLVMNSQHPLKTIAHIPEAIAELIAPKSGVHIGRWEVGKWKNEYFAAGGEQNTYFNRQKGTFEDKGKWRKVFGFPLDAISKANNFIERLPRMAEYIASRKEGRSIDVSMLDAARVTTNFAAGGDFAKFLNANGATFFNASIQGAVQNVRNIREARWGGWKVSLRLIGKIVALGLPGILFNCLIWDDDEEYEQLSDYVKENYYIVGKTEDGKFIRLPKGRTTAVIQDAFLQMHNLATGDNEIDLDSFAELVTNNLAPNNPIDNNIVAPIVQAIGNKTWYGEDLVPTRLQDYPAPEQYDESIDDFSKWLGGVTNTSPYKWNYLLDQYGGGLSDVLLPMMTTEAENGSDSVPDYIFAPWGDKFSADSVMNNQNTSDFYDLADELTKAAKSKSATDEDILRSKYVNAVNSAIGDLYTQKRKIQGSELSSAEKYKQAREIQQQINALSEKALDTYRDIEYSDFDGERYAHVGEEVFKWNEAADDDGEGEWKRLSGDQKTRYLVTSEAEDEYYASDGEHHYRRIYHEDGTAEWKKLDDGDYAKQSIYTSATGITPSEYWEYKRAIAGIEGEKDRDGETVSGSVKKNKYAYIDSLELDEGAKMILKRMTYGEDDTYNRAIVEYLNGRRELTYEDRVAILTELGMKVGNGGKVTW